MGGRIDFTEQAHCDHTSSYPSIEADGIEFAYNNTPVLDNISLKFEAGTFYSILGPNGCGKTTLLDILIGHLKPLAGSVQLVKDIDDPSGRDMKKVNKEKTDKNRTRENIHTLSKKEVARRIALVSQNYEINFPFTVREVVMMGRHPYIGRFSKPSAEDIDIADHVMRKTGTDLFASRKITDLSGGERQRCVFARALCQNTPLLFLDEAFSNMDISHSMKLLSIVRREVDRKKRAVISVFHDINLAAIWSDVLIFMKEGRVVASGPTDEVMNASVIDEVFHVKSEVLYSRYSGAKQAHFRISDTADNNDNG